jgi:uncharacterized protein (DUF486 family)
LLQIPADRIAFTTMSLGQLKILQEVITLAVFIPFAMFYMHHHAQARPSLGVAVPARHSLLRLPQLKTAPQPG